MRFHQFKEDKWSTLASRTISNYADELGPDSMDYDMLKTASELLDKDMLKQLAQHIEKSDTAPREYVMKKIADHDPETFKRMYGDQEGYLSLMKPLKSLMDDDDMMTSMNKYGIAVTKSKDGDFDVFQRDKPLGSFKSIQDVNRFLKNYLDGSSSLDEDAGDDKDVEKAKQIAKDKAGDMTRASQDIDKVKKGLSAHPDVADALKKANEELNRITKLAGLGEGASMLPYFKQDEKTWSFPDAWQNDEALDTPYMSNMSMREFLDGLGYDSNFEDASPVDAKEFVAKTTQWLQKNIDNPSKEIPTTIDKSGGGATMIGGGKPEGWMNRQVKHHNELARKILTKYPEVTHFGFN